MGPVYDSAAARAQRWLLATAAGVLAVSGCSADGDDPAPAGQKANASAQTTEVTPTVPARMRRPPGPPPTEGACYRLSAAEAHRPTDRSDPVPCARSHTAQTYHVGTMPNSVVEADDVAAIADYITPRCDNRFAQHVGSGRNVRVLSRLQPVWFLPTRSERARGARWFRCDVVGVAAADELARLPVTTAGVLEQAGILNTYGLCSTATPNLPGDYHVTCGQPHTWRAFAVIRPDSRGGKWPSRKRLAAARQDCKTRARAEQGFPLEWTYGWQPPTRAQWREGRRWGYCWVPER